MQIRFYVDPATGAPHIHNHHVAEHEVIEVLDEPGEDRAGRDGSRIVLGQTASGRYLRVIYVADPEGLFVVTAFDLIGRPLGRISKAKKEETTMSQSKFPEGWDEDRVRKLLANYQEQAQDEALAEDEAGFSSAETLMSVPHNLVSRVRELIAKHRH